MDAADLGWAVGIAPATLMAYRSAMDQYDIHTVFGRLTDKQDEVLRLACQHLTSKEIAKELGLAPVTIDKRIDAVRAKLGHMPRVEVLRHYRAWAEQYDQIIDDPAILTNFPPNAAPTIPQLPGQSYTFEDSLTFDGRAAWDRMPQGLQPGIKPSDLGIGGKLLLILVGAVAIMMVAVLSMAFANALGTMV